MTQSSAVVKFLGTNRLPHCGEAGFTGGDGWSYSEDINKNISFNVSKVYGGADAPRTILFEGNKIIIPGVSNSAEYIVQTVTEDASYFHVTASPTDINDTVSIPYQPVVPWFSASQSCPATQIYYTNEILRVRVEIQAYYDNTLYQWKVSGNPLLELNFFGPNGQITKYARYNDSYSSKNNYLEFNYVIEPTDIGNLTIGDGNSYPIVNDAENKVYFTNNNIDQNVIVSPPYISYSDTSRVRVNTEVLSNSGQSQFTILLKRSGTPGKIPTKDDLLCGELAMNTIDGKLFAKRLDDEIVTIGQSVIEYPTVDDFPVSGQTDVIYMTTDKNKLYRWDENEYYVQISSIEPQIFSVGNYSISSTQNNFNISNYSTVRISATSSGLGITGFTAGQDGEIRLIYNGGNYAIDIPHNSGLSSSGNKVLIYNSENFSLEVNAGITILYDAAYNSNAGAWRLF